MIKILFLFLAIGIYSSDAPEVKKIDRFVENGAQQQLIHPEELLNKINESKKDVSPQKRSGFQNNSHPKREIKTGSSRTHRDFTIYNFERLDEELAVIREDNLYLTEEISSIREREKVYIEALEGLLIRSKRYDHFFTKWDDLKETSRGMIGVGGGSLGTIIVGVIGFILQRRRKKKKQNGGSP